MVSENLSGVCEIELNYLSPYRPHLGFRLAVKRGGKEWKKWVSVQPKKLPRIRGKIDQERATGRTELPKNMNLGRPQKRRWSMKGMPSKCWHRCHLAVFVPQALT